MLAIAAGIRQGSCGIRAESPPWSRPPLNLLEENQLVARLRKRDDRAFSEMVLRHQGVIYNLCLRLSRSPAEAEDLAQDTFVRCFLSIGEFRGASRLSTWLYRIAINLSRNRAKYLERRRDDAADRFEDVPEATLRDNAAAGHSMGEPGPLPDEAMAGLETERRVQRSLARLEPDAREVLVLRDIEGLSYAEIVDITGLAEGTVKSRLHRARVALKAAFEAEGGSTR